MILYGDLGIICLSSSYGFMGVIHHRFLSQKAERQIWELCLTSY